FIRQAAINADQTYSLALAILFLDRLGDPVDIALIESMTVRLLAGQQANGAWSYNCPSIGADGVRRRAKILKQNNELKGSRELPKPGEARRGVKDLPKEIQQQLVMVQRGGAGPGAPMMGGDNSNTQFAVLGLWTARKHGLPVDAALERVEAHFRRSQ